LRFERLFGDSAVRAVGDSRTWCSIHAVRPALIVRISSKANFESAVQLEWATGLRRGSNAVGFTRLVWEELRELISTERTSMNLPISLRRAAGSNQRQGHPVTTLLTSVVLTFVCALWGLLAVGSASALTSGTAVPVPGTKYSAICGLY